VTTPAELAVDAMNSRFGSHPGYRAAHAKGTYCRGTFTAAPAAARLTRAAHMRGDPVDVLVRFSNGSGNPDSPDYARDARGMAVKFSLPDGSDTDVVSITLPRFFVRSPDDFIAFTRAAGAGLAAAWKLPLFLATHHEALPALRAFMALRPPASYATCRYNGIHAFRWIDPDGGERHVRYTWVPEGGERSLSTAEVKDLGRDYLRDELAERLGRGPARFTLQVQIADAEDPVDDATAVWPEERETVAVGTLELTALESGREEGGEVLVFDPVRVTDGIELSADPLIQFRSDAYSVSVDRRVRASG
jgi:catalase